MSSDVHVDDNLHTMTLAGTARRIVKSGTDTFYIWIPVYIDSYHKYHRALPNFLLPYKHYMIETIMKVLHKTNHSTSQQICINFISTKAYLADNKH